MKTKRKRSALLEHRVATCDYRFVLSRCPEHQRAGWRNAALTHERLIRAYTCDLKAKETQHALL